MSVISETFLFQPSQITGCTVWFDATDQTTITTSGNNVTRWVDKVSSIQALPNTTATLTTINGKQAVQIPAGSEMRFTATFGQSRSWFMVMRNDTQLSGSLIPFGLVHGYSATEQQMTVTFGTPYVFINNNASTAILANANTTNPYNILQIYTAIASGTSASLNAMTITGSALSLITSNVASGLKTTQVFTMSRADFNTGASVCEIIAYNLAVSTSQRQQVEGYLAWKWGLQANLPITHPYKTTRPLAVSGLSAQIAPSMPLILGNTNVFTPTQVSGCQLWLDAADSNSVIVTGTNVTQWNDKSGNNYNLTPLVSYSNLTVSPNFQNNLNVLNGTGLSQYLSPINSGTYPLDAFIIIAIKSGVNTIDVLSLLQPGVDNFTSLSIGGYANTQWNQSSTLGNRSYNTGFSETSTSFLIMEWQFANNNFAIRRNTTAIGTSTAYTWSTPPSPQFALGYRVSSSAPNVNFNAYVAEIVLYNNVLTTSQRQQVEGYLAWKWGLQANLPVGHPYKNFAIAPFPFTVTPRIGNTVFFRPTQISGSILWLDAADTTTISLSGTSVTQWRDKSGNGYNCSVSSGANSPDYLSQTMQFRSASQQSLTVAQGFGNALVNIVNYIIFFVGARRATGYQYFLSGATVAFRQTMQLGFQSSALTDYNLYGDDFQASVPAYSAPDPTYFMSFSSATNFRDIIINGTVGNTSTLDGKLSAFIEPQIGRRYIGAPMIYHNIDVREVICYNVSITRAQRQQVEGYLAWKWGLQANLPANHPFKLFPPSP